MKTWYRCPICLNAFPPEAQRLGLVCQHSPEEWAKSVADFQKAEPEEKVKKSS